MCRMRANNSIGYCCDSLGYFSDDCQVDQYDTENVFDFCSGDVNDNFALPFVCPYRWEECNKDSPNIVLTADTHVENEIEFISAAGSSFAAEICYF